MTEKKQSLAEIKRLGAPVLYVASSILSRGVGFLFTPIYTRYLSPAEYGIYSLFVSLMGIFTVITTLEISGSSIYRGFAKFDSDGGDAFTSAALGAAILTSGASLTLYIIFHNGINAITGLSLNLGLLLIIQIFFNTVEGLYLAKSRYYGNSVRVFAINAAAGILTPLLSITLIMLGGGGMSRVISPFIITGAIAAAIGISAVRKCRRLFSREMWKFLFGINLPMLAHYLALSLTAQGEKILISRIVGEGALGKYSVAYSVGSLVSLVGGGISLALCPWIIRNLKAEKGERVKRTVTHTARLIALFTLLFLTVLPEVFSIFSAPAYADALPIAYPISASVLFSFLCSALQSTLLYHGRIGRITASSVTTAALTLANGFFAIRAFGTVGAAFTSLASQILLFLLYLKGMQKHEGEGFLNVNRSLPEFLLFFFSCGLIFVLRISPFSRILLFFATSMLLLREAVRCKALLSR